MNPAGSTFKLRLQLEESHELLHVDLSLDRYAELGIAPGQRLYAIPRRVRVFLPEEAPAPEYSI